MAAPPPPLGPPPGPALPLPFLLALGMVNKANYPPQPFYYHPYQDRFQRQAAAPVPPHYPPTQAWIRPPAAYLPGDFPFPRPRHPLPNNALIPHVPYAPNPLENFLCNRLSAALASPQPNFIRPAVFPIEVTGEDPTAQDLPHAEQGQQIGRLSIIQYNPIKRDEHALSCFDPITGSFTGCIATRSWDHEFGDDHGPVRDYIVNRMAQFGERFAVLLTTRFLVGQHHFSPTQTGFAIGAVYSLGDLPEGWDSVASSLPSSILDGSSVAAQGVSYRAERALALQRAKEAMATVESESNRFELNGSWLMEDRILSSPRLDATKLLPVPLDGIRRSGELRLNTIDLDSVVVRRSASIGNDYCGPALLTRPDKIGSIERPRSDFIAKKDHFGHVHAGRKKGDLTHPCSIFARHVEYLQDQTTRGILASNDASTSMSQLPTFFDTLIDEAPSIARTLNTSLFPPFSPPEFSPYFSLDGSPISSDFWDDFTTSPRKRRHASDTCWTGTTPQVMTLDEKIEFTGILPHGSTFFWRSWLEIEQQMKEDDEKRERKRQKREEEEERQEGKRQREEMLKGTWRLGFY